jgi:hypothetical protein
MKKLDPFIDYLLAAQAKAGPESPPDPDQTWAEFLRETLAAGPANQQRYAELKEQREIDQAMRECDALGTVIH